MTRLVLALLIGWGGGASAQQGPVFDPGPMLGCLSVAETPSICIGAAAEQCMLETPDGQTTAAMAGCLDAERQWWDARLNAVFQGRLAEARAADAQAKAGGFAAPPQEVALRQMQRDWIAFRDSRCAWVASLWGGGTGQGPAATGCHMQATAEQALYLETVVP